MKTLGARMGKINIISKQNLKSLFSLFSDRLFYDFFTLPGIGLKYTTFAMQTHLWILQHILHNPLERASSMKS